MEGVIVISNEGKHKIQGYLEGFIQGLIDEFEPPTGINPRDLRETKTESKKGDIKPFHEAIIPDGLMRINEFERSFSTRLGTTYEEVAKIIAHEHHEDAQRQYKVEGVISSEAIKKIEFIKNSINSGGFKGADYLQYVKDVVNVAKGKGEERYKIADLYILTKNKEEMFFEIKSPKPNKGQCLEATERLLEFHALKKTANPKVQSYYAMAYNPYGIEKEKYKHSFVVNYMDLNNQVLIGKDFWKLVGGTDTYSEVLEIYRKVGREKGPDMIDKLALGY